jgi:DNA polymerase III epsilon subunit-like protein
MNTWPVGYAHIWKGVIKLSEFEALVEVVKRNNFVVLDTETTGLYHVSEVCQLAVVDCEGKVLIDTLIKPSRQIPWDAIQIHGIKNEDVANAPSIGLIGQALADSLRGRDLIIYNAGYDLKILAQSFRADKAMSLWEIISDNAYLSVTCAMYAYAEFYGDWNEYHQSYTWQRLTAAIRQQGLQVDAAHSAVGDCQMTLALVKHLATVKREATE